MDGFFEKVYSVVKKIPQGKVVSYGQIAREIGAPRCARQVGFALHVNPRPIEIPCHRVVNKSGRLAPAFAFGGAEIQKDLLESEGVKTVFSDGEYYIEKQDYFWNFDRESE